MEESAENVYNRIQMLRAERGIFQSQTIGYLERGEYKPSLHLTLRIADFFEVPVEILFSLTPFKRLGD